MSDLYLVTGGAGFIGSHITERLLSEGKRVRVLDNFSTGYRKNLEPFQKAHGDLLEVMEGDVSVLDDCRQAVDGVKYIMHEAALASVPRSLSDPIACHHNNATGTLNMLVSARDAKVSRFVYAGSSSVYGDSKKLPKDESMYTRPLSPYALAKLDGEEYLRLFNMHYGMETVTLRYFNVFGPRQDPNSAYAAVIPLFVNWLLAGEAPVVHGDGLQSRDFTFVTNVVDANLAACHADGVSGVFNIACNDRITLLELLERIQVLLGTNIPPKHIDTRQGDVRHSQADISKAVKELGYSPRVALAEGLAPTVAYFKELATSRS
jgi:UDP-N-acetylglucosamine/UDP-N-acetyl-alpha-D-glucosaminouronate 4-epimerase